jgi:hypothetical protein
MQLQEIRQHVHAASLTRFPSIRVAGQRGNVAQAIEQIADYVVKTAHVEGDLTQAKFALVEAKELLDDQWGAIDTSNLPASATLKRREEERKAKEPGLAASRAEMKRLLSQLTEQVDRMQLDYTRASRLYTMLTGRNG